MDGYLIIKYLHIMAVAITVGGVLARQLVRGAALKSEELGSITALTHTAIAIDRRMVIPGGNLILVLGVILALMQKWPIFGFLQGASRNWLLASNLLLIAMLALIPAVFIPDRKKVESALLSAQASGQVTPELRTAQANPKSRLAHNLEYAILLIIAALMVLKPF